MFRFTFFLFSILYIIYLETELKTLLWGAHLGAHLLRKIRLHTLEEEEKWSHHKNWKRFDPTRKTDIPFTHSSLRRGKTPPVENFWGTQKEERMQGMYLENPAMEAGVRQENLHKIFLWSNFPNYSASPHLCPFLCVSFKEHEKSLNLEDFLDALHLFASCRADENV